MKILSKLMIALILSSTIIVSANATSISGLFGGSNHIEDDSIEWLINGSNSTSDDLLEQGDRLRGVVSFQSVNGTNIGSGTEYDEFTGVFDLTVANIINTGSSYVYSFAATDIALSGFTTAGTIMELYTDPNKDLSSVIGVDESLKNMLDRNTAESLATNGTSVMTISMDGSDDFWFFNSITNDISLASSLTVGQNIGDGNFALTITKNDLTDEVTASTVSYIDDAGNLHRAESDLYGNVSVYSPVSGAIADVVDDTDVWFTSAVPEPTTMLLFGIGVLGFAGVTRKRMI